MTDIQAELRAKLLDLRITVWKQVTPNGQANLDHDSVDEILAIIAKQLDKAYRTGYAAGNAKKNYAKLKNKDDVENILQQFRIEFYASLYQVENRLLDSIKQQLKDKE